MRYPRRGHWKQVVQFKSRRGKISTGIAFVGGSLAFLVIMLGVLIYAPPKENPETSVNTAQNSGDQSSAKSEAGETDSGSANQESESLVMYCAAGIKPPVAEAAAQFAAEEFGVPIQLQYGGSGTLLSNLQVAKKGDLYLAADTSYIEIARKKNLLKEAVPVAQMHPVIMVKKGNPKQIQSIDDLIKEGVTVSLANPDAASIGKLTKKELEKAGKWDALSKSARVFKPTVSEVANDVLLGAVDAGIVWDATVNQHADKVEMIEVPEFSQAIKNVTVGVLNSSAHPQEALMFARYLQAPEKGQELFAKQGYQTVKGDTWEPHPQILLFSGGVNRLAIQDTLKEFEKREGVSINVVYNGCGILVGQINSGQKPDAYFACDTSYMVQVQPKFTLPLTVAETDMIIIVEKGNPKKIKSVYDLAGDDIKVGIAHHEQSALGALTKKLLGPLVQNDKSLYDAIQPNVKTNTPTADLLVNQLRTGSLDAAIVYRANIAKVADKLDVVEIKEGRPLAEQPIAILKSTKYPNLMQRLVDQLTSDSSRVIFESRGFRWRITPESI
ncbi:molybdate ABC transporter substrate-binding protein [Gimesia fumaroli]|uniref:Binding protein n=1 Tax=Gimesia fumaroli TaxID=2527976 RepID=A0A518IBZ8_9PLAN|nr:molybdate ABC transporter substrate-binding protein [Gimesia fumaroli]QDV50615.1 Putative binding protein precursor [Gimesia fumaroli]